MTSKELARHFVDTARGTLRVGGVEVDVIILKAFSANPPPGGLERGVEVTLKSTGVPREVPVSQLP